MRPRFGIFILWFSIPVWANSLTTRERLLQDISAIATHAAAPAVKQSIRQPKSFESLIKYIARTQGVDSDCDPNYIELIPAFNLLAYEPLTPERKEAARGCISSSDYSELMACLNVTLKKYLPKGSPLLVRMDKVKTLSDAQKFFKKQLVGKSTVKEINDALVAAMMVPFEKGGLGIDISPELLIPELAMDQATAKKAKPWEIFAPLADLSQITRLKIADLAESRIHSRVQPKALGKPERDKLSLAKLLQGKGNSVKADAISMAHFHGQVLMALGFQDVFVDGNAQMATTLYHDKGEPKDSRKAEVSLAGQIANPVPGKRGTELAQMTQDGLVPMGFAPNSVDVTLGKDRLRGIAVEDQRVGGRDIRLGVIRWNPLDESSEDASTKTYNLQLGSNGEREMSLSIQNIEGFRINPDTGQTEITQPITARMDLTQNIGEDQARFSFTSQMDSDTDGQYAQELAFRKALSDAGSGNVFVRLEEGLTNIITEEGKTERMANIKLVTGGGLDLSHEYVQFSAHGEQSHQGDLYANTDQTSAEAALGVGNSDFHLSIESDGVFQTTTSNLGSINTYQLLHGKATARIAGSTVKATAEATQETGGEKGQLQWHNDTQAVGLVVKADQKELWINYAEQQYREGEYVSSKQTTKGTFVLHLPRDEYAELRGSYSRSQTPTSESSTINASAYYAADKWSLGGAASLYRSPTYESVDLSVGGSAKLGTKAAPIDLTLNATAVIDEFNGVLPAGQAVIVTNDGVITGDCFNTDHSGDFNCKVMFEVKYKFGAPDKVKK